MWDWMHGSGLLWLGTLWMVAFWGLVIWHMALTRRSSGGRLALVVVDESIARGKNDDAQ